ncbi:MAG: hypothetical protein KAW12_25610 [Candidatus Aminicenantes bacterium]|nr:hypothetical protein [Candidatus Aminicenantes bacterium]
MTSKKDIHTNMEHLNDSSSALYVDALVRDDLSMLPAEALDHVENCTECKDKILDLFLFRKNPAAAPVDSPAGQVVEFPQHSRRQKSQFRRAATIFIVFSFVLIFYFLGIKNELTTLRQTPAIGENKVQEQPLPGTPETGQETAAKVEKTRVETGTAGAKKTPPRPSVPPAYRVNPNLENMIGSPSRSGVVHILSPGNNIYLQEEILFSWEETKQEPLHLKILNNKNEVLFRYEVKDSRYLFKEELSPGLYYWKLESQSDLLYVGKFFIK